MTSRTWKDAQDMSLPNISRYTSFKRAVALRSVECHGLLKFLFLFSLTHIFSLDLGSTFFQTVLNILLLVPFVIPQTSDEVV